MNKFYVISVIVFHCCFITLSAAKNIYVATNGDDDNPGSLASPMKTLQAAVDLLSAGDTLYIMEGTYRQKVRNTWLKGSSGNPIVITSYPGHKVTLDGTVDINGNWELYQENMELGRVDLSRETVDERVDQLTLTLERAETGGVLRITWESLSFTVSFTVGQ